MNTAIRKPSPERANLFLAALLALALAIVPFSFGFAAGASDAGHAHATAGANHGDGMATTPAPDDGAVHMASHCGAQLCAPSFVNSAPSNAPLPTGWARIGAFPDNTATLRALYLESDPPVPKPAFS